MGEQRRGYSGYENFIKVKSGSAAEDVHFSMFCKDLTDDLTEAALRELNETEENRTKGIKSLKEFVKKKELRCEDEELLIWVLRNCKYDIKKSKNKLERFLRTRHFVGRKLSQIPISTVKDALNEMAFGLLPYRDKYGRIIVFIRPLLQVRNYDTDLLASVLLSCVMFILSLPMTSVLGTVYIGESENVSIFVMYPLMKFYKSFASHVFDIPLRIRRVHIIKENFAARWVYRCIRIFLPQKVTERVSFLGSEYTKLHEIYPPDILPEDIGGNLGPFNDEIYRKELLNFIEKLKSEYT